MSTAPVVAVIHATTASLGPVNAAFTLTCPGVELWHLLDDRLVKDAEASGGLTAELHDRMSTLITYAIDGGAVAVQLACSMYGPVAAARRGAVPVFPSDEAMFDEAVRRVPRRVGVLASLAPAAVDTADRLTDHLRAAGSEAVVEAVPVPDAAGVAGDLRRLENVLSRAAVELATRVDVIVLAQYSLAPARDAVAAAVDVPVLSAPHLAGERLLATLPHTVDAS